MKKRFVIYMCVICLSLVSCSPLTEPDKVLMEAHFDLQVPEGLDKDQIQQVNFVVDLDNVNTKEHIHKGSIDDLKFQLSLMRGLYIIHIDGVALVEKDGKPVRIRLRGYLENYLLLESNETHVVPLSLMK